MSGFVLACSQLGLSHAAAAVPVDPQLLSPRSIIMVNPVRRPALVRLASACLLLLLLPLLLQAMVADDSSRSSSAQSDCVDGHPDAVDCVNHYQRWHGVSSAAELDHAIGLLAAPAMRQGAEGSYSGMVPWFEGSFGTVISRASPTHKFRLSCPEPDKWSDSKCTHEDNKGRRKQRQENRTVASVCVSVVCAQWPVSCCPGGCASSARLSCSAVDLGQRCACRLPPFRNGRGAWLWLGLPPRGTCAARGWRLEPDRAWSDATRRGLSLAAESARVRGSNVDESACVLCPQLLALGSLRIAVCAALALCAASCPR